MENIVSAAKTDVFRVRINPEIKQELESVYAKNGLTLTDAINVFFQQSLNAGGFPFAVTEDNAEIIKAKALSRLTKQLIFYHVDEEHSTIEILRVLDGRTDYLSVLFG